MNSHSFHKGVLKYFFPLILFLLTTSSIASEKIDVKGIRYWSSPGYTRIVIDLSSPAEFSTNRLSDPDRVYFDLKNSRLKKEIKTTLPVGDRLLKPVRAGQFDARTVRAGERVCFNGSRWASSDTRSRSSSLRMSGKMVEVIPCE